MFGKICCRNILRSAVGTSWINNGRKSGEQTRIWSASTQIMLRTKMYCEFIHVIEMAFNAIITNIALIQITWPLNFHQQIKFSSFNISKQELISSYKIYKTTKKYLFYNSLAKVYKNNPISLICEVKHFPHFPRQFDIQTHARQNLDNCNANLMRAFEKERKKSFPFRLLQTVKLHQNAALNDEKIISKTFAICAVTQGWKKKTVHALITRSDITSSVIKSAL